MAMPPDFKPPAGKPRIERLPALPPPDTLYRPVRKRLQLICFLIFVALPFLDLMRFDIPRQRFYFAGFELWISEFAIIFFALMFLMFLVVASAVIYGRVYCGYMCPQMIFSEWSTDVRTWARKAVQRRFPGWPAGRGRIASEGLWYAVLVAGSMFLAFVFTSYFVEPRDLFGRLMHLDIRTAGGITGAIVTLATFLDLALVRQRFCTTVCPYGYLQGMLQDGNTLLVAYGDKQPGGKLCIECRKCVRVCEMGIDIRKSPFQIECVHCGECIDACEDVMRRIGRPGLIHYSWGEAGTQHVREPWYRRLGFRDAKRLVILVVLVFYAVGLVVALSMRRPVMVRAVPDRTALYRLLPDGRVSNTIRLNLANRSARPVSVAFRSEGLPGAELALQPNPLPLAAGQALETKVELRVPRWKDAQEVNRFRLLAQPSNETTPDVFEITFIMPAGAGGRDR